jgi:ribosomal-protein-alanine N-acetyltransferase
MAVLAKITTARLRIVPFEERHLTSRYVNWLNDPTVVRFSEQRHRRHDLMSCRTYFESIKDSDNYFCAIENIEDGRRHIGNVTVYSDRPNRLADIAILIGDRSIWGTGLGFESWSGVLRALIERDGFRKVTGGCLASNRAMVRIMEKAGMTLDGRRTAHCLIDGNPVDIVHYAAFAAVQERLPAQ